MPDRKRVRVTTATTAGTVRIVETDNGSTFLVKDTLTYRTDFPDGSYVTGSASSTQTYNSHASISTATIPIVEKRNIYSADGTVIGRVLIHAVTHLTVNTETGVVHSSIDRFHFTCL